MNPLNLITDSYERPARLYPALLLIAPLVAAGVGILSANWTALQSVAATVVGCGGAFLLTQLARDSGKKGEKHLFEKWGGLPSVAIFRHRDTRLEEAKAPTVEEEQADPMAADEVYTAWSNYLRVNTRDTKKFALLFQENINYGYRRNVWGLRPIGVIVCVVSCLACGVQFYVVHQSTGKLDGAVAGAGAFAFALLMLWVFRFSSDWVRVPADAYAARLAECAESIPAKASAPKT